MIKSILILTLSLSLLTACNKEAEKKNATSEPQVSAEETIRNNIRHAFPNIPVDDVRKTDVGGLYEIRSGKQLFYSDANGNHAIFGGQIIEAASKRNLTKERLEEINKIDWARLPLDKAIISGDKNSKLELAVFTDPDCPYCRMLEKELARLEGVKVYTFLYPLEQLHPKAKGKAKAIWCAEDQHAMLTEVMVNNADPEAGTCEHPIDEIQALARELGINGTPALIAGDGRMAAGGKKAADLKAWLTKQ